MASSRCVYYVPGLRRFLMASVTFGRLWSTIPQLQAGQKIRLSRGQSPDGIAYGPLTDLPDWSYSDGTPAPETKRRRLRQLRRLDVAHRIATYIEEVEQATRKRDKEGNPLECQASQQKKDRIHQLRGNDRNMKTGET